jgi:hypothetical protein
MGGKNLNICHYLVVNMAYCEPFRLTTLTAVSAMAIARFATATTIATL